MLTELCLASDEFDHFAVQAHNSVTFCLKELRVRQRTKEGVMEQQNRRISQEGEDWGNLPERERKDTEDNFQTVLHYIHLADAIIQSNLQWVPCGYNQNQNYACIDLLIKAVR